MIIKVLKIIILFFYIYSVKFTIIPFGLNTRIILTLLGFISYIINSFCLLKLKYLSKTLKIIINNYYSGTRKAVMEFCEKQNIGYIPITDFSVSVVITK
jgi:hypothetical protein